MITEATPQLTKYREVPVTFGKHNDLMDSDAAKIRRCARTFGHVLAVQVQAQGRRREIVCLECPARWQDYGH